MSSQRLLPEDAYPAGLDEAAKDQVDRSLRKKHSGLPSRPGAYRDGEGEIWTLDEAGAWTDPKGKTKPAPYAPLLGLFGPWSTAE